MNKTIISLEEGREALRIDGDFNDDIIEPLIEAIPNYLYITTGRTWLDDNVPLAQQQLNSSYNCGLIHKHKILNV